ncbi:hypothetical protein BST61_g2232 [Cercospora zeina]
MPQLLYVSRPRTLLLHLARTRFLHTRGQGSTPPVERRRKWTKDEDGFTLRRRREGAKISSIADELGRTTGSVNHRYTQHLRPLEANPGFTERSLTRHDDDIIIQRKCEGVAIRTIAKGLLCPEGRVQRRWRILRFKSDVPEAVLARALRPRSKLGHLNRPLPRRQKLQRHRKGIAVQCENVRHWYRSMGSSRNERYEYECKALSDLERQTALRRMSEGWTILAIATELGRSYGLLVRFLRTQRAANATTTTRIVRPFTAGEDQKLLELQKDGTPVHVIGTLLGRVPGSLTTRLELLCDSEVDELIRQYDQGIDVSA